MQYVYFNTVYVGSTKTITRPNILKNLYSTEGPEVLSVLKLDGTAAEREGKYTLFCIKAKKD